MSLAQLSSVLRLGDAAKDAAGKALLKYFTEPCRSTKANGGRTRNYPEHDPDKFQALIRYCEQDVRAEMAVHHLLTQYPLPDFEWRLYAEDQRINDAGLMTDDRLAASALRIRAEQKKALLSKARHITGGINPNSNPQMCAWFSEKLGREVTSIAKEPMAGILAETNDPDVIQVAELRSAVSRSSVSKYKALLQSRCADGRLRGTFQMNGAGRTCRWAGRRFQPQNMPRNGIPNLDRARELIRAGSVENLAAEYPEVYDTLSQCIRTAIVAPRGRVYVVCDYSAIEARVTAFLAGEQWRLDIFNTHGKIYEASASLTFGVPLEEITKDSPWRQQGKVTELALGYGGSVGAMRKMDYGNVLPEDDLEVKQIVTVWRAKSPMIVRFWRDVENMAKRATRAQGLVLRHTRTGITMLHDGTCLRIKLPSGRCLSYWKAHLGEGRYGEELRYYGRDGETGKWVVENTYGGKLTENIVQAYARDLLADALVRMPGEYAELGHLHGPVFTVGHVHDEMIAECDARDGEIVLATQNRVMSEPPEWAAGTPIVGDGFITEYYKKD